MKKEKWYAVVMANGKTNVQETSHKGLAQIIKTDKNVAHVQFINPSDWSDFTWYKYTTKKGNTIDKALKYMIKKDSIGKSFNKVLRNNPKVNTKKVTNKKEINDLQMRYGHKI